MRGPGLAAAASAAERFLLAGVLIVAVAGVAAPEPGRVISSHNGVGTVLAILVFATGISLRVTDLTGVRRAWRRITVVLAVSTVTLPALAWTASLLIGDPVLRSGMQTVGIAPAEVATVALCAMAGGEAAVCAVLLVASTVITVLAAGPVLALLGARVIVPAAGLLGSLALIVALPLAAGLAVRAAWSPGQRAIATIRLVTVAALLVLLWQVASQIRLDPAYARVAGALFVYLVAATALGWLLGTGQPAGRATAVLLPVALRDFAVAAGIATAAFGPAAAAPLGAYGVLVLLAGSVVTLRARRTGAGPPGERPG